MKKLLLTIAIIGVIVYGYGKITGQGSEKEFNTDRSITEANDSSFDELEGTYVGLHGSGITLESDGSAEYYWKEWPQVDTSGTWKYAGGRVTAEFDSLGYEIYADVEDGNAATLTFEADYGWDEEMFVKVSSDTTSKSAEEYIALIEKQLGVSLSDNGGQSDATKETQTKETTQSTETQTTDVGEQTEQTAEVQAAEVQEEAKPASASGVDPDLKAFLDSYEAFIDDYVVIMQKYQANPSDLSILTDYASMLEKYSTFEETLNQYDSSTMSAADSAYYLEVTTRCYQKMLAVAASTETN